MNKEQKAAVVEELSKELSDSEAIFAVDYRGISVPQAAELRADLRDADTRFRVVKNRLTLLAADKAGTESIKEHLEGPTALALVKGDPAQAAKTIFKLGREWEVLEYKGGLMEGEALDADSFQQIAKLPGRDQMNAQIAGIVASPLTGLVRGLGSMVQGLASQLQQMADQGLVTGEAPAEETPKEVDAPAAADDEKASDEEAGGGEDASSDEAGDGPSSEADPDPKASPEEAPSEEQAPEGEDAGQGEAEQTGEGDAEMGEAAEGAQEGGDESAAETSEDSNDEDKEESE